MHDLVPHDLGNHHIDGFYPMTAAIDAIHRCSRVDFLVVCSSWLELFAQALPISPTFLRLLRLGKLLRALRVVRMSQVLEPG